MQLARDLKLEDTLMNEKISINVTLIGYFKPWLVWLSGLSADL